jgi:hypothetical protein
LSLEQRLGRLRQVSLNRKEILRLLIASFAFWERRGYRKRRQHFEESERSDLKDFSEEFML